MYSYDPKKYNNIVIVAIWRMENNVIVWLPWHKDGDIMNYFQ